MCDAEHSPQKHSILREEKKTTWKYLSFEKILKKLVENERLLAYVKRAKSIHLQ